MAGLRAAVAVIALDAMGGDRAPEEIVAGGVRAAAELDVEILLVGPPDASPRTCPAGRRPRRRRCCPRTKSSRWATSPPTRCAPRRTRRSCAAPRRSATAARHAMVGAGNTGATMAAALLRMGRIRGVARPAIAVPLPVPGSDRGSILLDAGATVDPEPAWLVQWARARPEYATVRFGIEAPTIGLLSNGEEAGKGDDLRKQAGALLADVKGFVGNVEGRDLLAGAADVVVTDGFTGNIALKTARRRDARPRRARVLRRGRARVGLRRRRLEAAAARGGRAAVRTTPAGRCSSA